MKWCTLVLVAGLAFAWASSPATSSAQGSRDLIIDPPSGGAGSRFQIVGAEGWTAGETVSLKVGFTASPDPLAFLGPFAIEQQLPVLPDGTWSFPVVVNESIFQGAPPDEPGAIIVRAASLSHSAVAAFQYTGLAPPPASDIAAAGFGPGAPPATLALLLALFAAGTGVLLVMSGAWRRLEPGSSR